MRGLALAGRGARPLDCGVGQLTDLLLLYHSTIRLWSLATGACVHTLSGHDSFVYSLAALPDALSGGLVSGGEDRTVRVWRAQDGECTQTIVVPAVSGAFCVSRSVVACEVAVSARRMG